eukprot:gene31390-37941_t
MSDERVRFIIDNVYALCRLQHREALSELQGQAGSSKAVSEFLEDPRCPSLLVTMDEKSSFSFTCDLGRTVFDGNNSVGVLFVKRSRDPITADSIRNDVEVHTMKGSPLENLLTSLQGIWCPALLENTQVSETLPARIVQLLSELKSTLATSVQSGQGSSRRDNAELDNVADIRSVADELNFWNRMKEDRRSPFRSLAKQVDIAMADLQKFMDFDNLDLSSASELIDVTLDILNNVWSSSGEGQAYPQSRMTHLFDCIGKVVFNYVQSQLGGVDIWNSANSAVRAKLQNCIYICDRWCDVPKQLTSTFWSTAGHPWRGRVHDDVLVGSLARRLEQVVGILTLSEELSQILPPADRSNFQLDRLFDPLRHINPVFYNPYTESTWQKAVKEYERLVDPVEAAVASRLRKCLAPYLDNAFLLLAEFQKYKNLLYRPAIRRAVASERETLLSLLREKIRQIENIVDKDDLLANGSDDEAGRGAGVGIATGIKAASPLILSIIRLRQLGARVKDVYASTKALLDDLDAFAKFSSLCDSLIHKIKNEEDGRYENWLSDVNQRLKDGDETLRLQGSLLGWKDGVLVVNYPESLVRFLREYRQLDELGFDLPKPSSGGKKRTVGDCAVEAERFYRFGILLKKTSNFYNTISEQIIDVQEQLLLGSLSSFANLVSSSAQGRGKSDLSWSNPAECENFVKTLQEAAEKLANENRSLRKVHEWLCSQTVGLMGIELHRQGELWKSKWRTMKEKMTSVKSRYAEKDCKLWVQHWDNQVYKALEVSYQMGLECINESVSEIKIELVFANKMLDFKPPLEQIRQSYYRELKKFVSIPYNFEGFGNAQIFKKMGPRNMKGLVQVYAKAEALMGRLQDVVDRYASWAILAQVDLDAYIEHNVKTSDEYVLNFKMLRVKRKDIDKLPDMEKVDCCTISLVPFKSFLDDLLLRTADVLLINLRRSLIEEFKEVDQYLESSMEKLNTKPRTVDEIGDAKKQWKEIDGKKNAMMGLSKNCVEKKKVLLQYAPGTAVDISEITAKMANLDGEG